MHLDIALQVPGPGGRDVHCGHAADVQLMAIAGEAGTIRVLGRRMTRKNAAEAPTLHSLLAWCFSQSRLAIPYTLLPARGSASR
jgi:hypothetical protein